MKNLCPLFPILAFLFPAAVGAAPDFKVVLDPGHGGQDHGTEFSSGRLTVREKEATLLIARQVAEELKTRKISVTLTRTRDEDVSLGDRTALANRIKADLFLSIHMNSALNPEAAHAEGAQGFETYILNNTTDDSSKRLARLENTVLGSRGADSKTENVDVALILRDLRLDANLAESKRLACAVQEKLLKGIVGYHLRVRDRGVKQALFHVLLGAEMPSALLEAGFLSNAQDRAVILSPKGRKAMAKAIAAGIEQFRDSKDTPEGVSALTRCKVH